MKIVTVEYRRLKTFGGYNNETIGAVAEVTPGVEPSSTLTDLKEWVDAQFSDKENVYALADRAQELRWQAEEAERRIERANEKWAAIMAFLEKLGIERPSDIPGDLDGLPF